MMVTLMTGVIWMNCQVAWSVASLRARQERNVRSRWNGHAILRLSSRRKSRKIRQDLSREWHVRRGPVQSVPVQLGMSLIGPAKRLDFYHCDGIGAVVAL
jgi:hypothetical protein